MCKSANVDMAVLEVNSDAPEYVLDTPNSDRARQQAKDEGLIVVVPTASQLQIDLDSEEEYQFFLKQIATYNKEIAHVWHKVGPSKGGLPKRHVTVELFRKITNTERILLQTLLGSDRTREILSWVQELNGDANPTLFLEKPEAVK